MSTIGTPIDMSLLQTAQAQQKAGNARDLERARNERSRRTQDRVELRIGDTEDSDALRRLPHNDSEQAGSEQRAKHHGHLTFVGDDDDQDDALSTIDVTA